MVKKEQYIGLGIDTDTAPDKRKTDAYYDATNIRVVNNGRSLSIKPIEGYTDLQVTFPTIVFPDPLQTGQTGYRKVLGTNVYNNTICLFTHIETILNPISGPTYTYYYDELIKIDTNYNLVVLASGDWNLRNSNPIESLINYENDNLVKLYFIDGINQLRSINIAITTPYGTITVDDLNMVSSIDLSTPIVTLEGTGSLIAGTIQYVYNMYNIYGTESMLSPASNLISISNYYSGYESQQNTGLQTKIVINPVDTTFDSLRIYSIHYQELNQTPVIKIIYDAKINSSTLTFYDDGLSTIATYSLQELLNKIVTPLIPNTIATKRERLFIGNYTVNNFNPDIDMRAYAYPLLGTTTFLSTNEGVSTQYSKTTLDTNFNPIHDCINSFPDTQFYQYHSTNIGATGLNIKVDLGTTPLSNNSIPYKSLKQGETYRIGVILYNNIGQKSPVKWIMDIKIPITIYNETTYLITQLTSIGCSNCNTLDIVKYQVCIVERKQEDRTVLSQGFIVPSVKYFDNNTAKYITPYTYPYYIAKDIIPTDLNATFGGGGNIGNSYAQQYGGKTIDWDYVKNNILPEINNDTVFFYSTDTVLENTLITPDKVRLLGCVWVGTFPESGNMVVKEYGNDIIIKNVSTTGYNTRLDFAPDISGAWFPTFECIMGKATLHTTQEDKIYVAELTTEKIYTNKINRDFFFFGGTDIKRDVQKAIFFKEGEIKSVDSNLIISNGGNINDLLKDIDYTDSVPISFPSNFCGTMMLHFSTTDWHRITSGIGYDYDAFDLIDTVNKNTYTRALPIVELLKTVSNQYGGKSYEDRQRNEYLEIGNIHSIDTNIHSDYIGDIWVGDLTINRLNTNDNKLQAVRNYYEYITIRGMENNHNVYARTDQMYNWSNNLPVSSTYNYFRISDNHKLLGAYNQVSNVFKDYAEPYTFKTIDTFPLTVLGSNSKTPNELIDNWLTFPPSNIKNLEGQFGALAKLHNLNGDLIGLQSTGIVFLEIEPRVQTVDSGGSNIQLGIGDLFYNHKYLLTNTGTNNKWTVCEDGKNLYYHDTNLNILCTLHDGKLSTLKSVKTIIDLYPNGPHSITYFNKLDHVYFQYDDFTLVYDILLQKFVSKYTFENNNRNLVSNGLNLLQFNDSNDIVLYKQYNGNVRSSSITYLVCPDALFEKTFHNLEYRLIGNDFDSIEVNNERSTSGNCLSDSKIKFDIHRIHLPRVKNSRERWRGIYIFVKLNNTKEYSLDNLVVMYNLKG
jgi:hypothetical protein